MAQSLNSGNSQTSSGGEDVFQTIEKLHQLLSKGVITQQEFDSKKADLLKKI
jgi:hypothetical protein